MPRNNNVVTTTIEVGYHGLLDFLMHTGSDDIESIVNELSFEEAIDRSRTRPADGENASSTNQAEQQQPQPPLEEEELTWDERREAWLKTQKFRRYFISDLCNDDNVPVQFSRNLRIVSDEEEDIHTCQVYCERFFGRDIIPRSDGRCGPNDGNSCPSCTRLREQDHKFKRECLKRLFPGLYILFSDRINVYKSDSLFDIAAVVHGNNDEMKWIRKHEVNEYRIDIEKYCSFDVNHDKKGSGEEDTFHFLDAFLIQILRRHQGHFTKSLKEVREKYRELQQLAELKFHFPFEYSGWLDESIHSEDSYDDGNDWRRKKSNYRKVIPLNPNLALSIPWAKPPKTKEYNNSIESICEVTNIDTAIAEYYFRDNNFDVEETIEYMINEEISGLSSTMDKEDESYKKLQTHMNHVEEMDEIHEESAKTLQKKRKIAIYYSVDHALEMVKNEKVVEKLKEWKESLMNTKTFEPLHDTFTEENPSMIPSRGHRMILGTNRKNQDGTNKPFHCRACTSQVPSREGGLYYSEKCNLCEGCVQTPYLSVQENENIDENEEEEKKEVDRQDYKYLYCPMVQVC